MFQGGQEVRFGGPVRPDSPADSPPVHSGEKVRPSWGGAPAERNALSRGRPGFRFPHHATPRDGAASPPGPGPDRSHRAGEAGFVLPCREAPHLNIGFASSRIRSRARSSVCRNNRHGRIENPRHLSQQAGLPEDRRAAGREEGVRRKPIFVIQKHDASSLHYDFRLGGRRRAQVLGGSQGSLHRSPGEAAGRAHRGPPAGLRRLRGGDPRGGVRRRDGHRVGRRLLPEPERRTETGTRPSEEAYDHGHPRCG